LDLGSKCSDIAQISAEIAEKQADLQVTTKRIEQLRTERQIAERIEFVSRGDMPLAPSKDKRKAMAAAGALGLGGAGVGLVLLFGFLDRRIRHFDDVKTTAQSNRVLGVLPMLPSEDSADPEQAMVAAHGVHQIRMLLQGRIQSRKNSVIAVTSASAGAGKTSLTMALGLSFAASGARTLLIDCDMIGGGLTSKLKRVTRRRTGCVLRRLGLITTEQLVGAVRTSRRRGERIGETLIRHGLVTRADVDHALQVQQESPVGLREALMGDPPNECITGGGSPNLFVMPLGSAQPQHVAQMSYPALQRLVSQVRGWFDVVLIDTGPILGSLEASVAAMVADDVVLAVAKGEHRPLIDRAIQHLGSVGGRLAGIVLNRANADDILASNFSSSASSNRQSTSVEQHGALKVRSGDHRCLQLGPIGRAVVAASDIEPPAPTAPFAPQPRPGDSTP
jgi:Mrp family chromosome partitioning ATPase